MSSQAKKKLVIALLAIMVTVAITWKLNASDNKKEEDNKQSVGIITAQEATANLELDVAGFVKAQSRADISPSVSGKIVRILKHEGESVKKGEVLAIIDAEQSLAQLNAANATIEALKKTLELSEQYYDQTVDQSKESGADNESIQTAKRARDLQIQATRNQLIIAEGSKQVAKAGLNNFNLTAPFSGTITGIYGREGGFANFSMPLFSISGAKGLEIETYINASSSHLLTTGLIANFKTPDNQIITGTVVNIAPANESSHFKNFVRLRINDESQAIKLGEFLEGKLLIPTTKTTIYIPKKAIVNRGGSLIVFTLDEKNVVHQNIVEIGNEKENTIEITSGISAGQKVIIIGQQYILTGSTVKSYESK